MLSNKKRSCLKIKFIKSTFFLPFVCLCLSSFVCSCAPSLFANFVCLFVCLLCLFVCLFLFLFVCVVVCSFIVCLFCLFVCLFAYCVCLFVCFFFCLCGRVLLRCLLIVFVCLSVSFFVCLFVWSCAPSLFAYCVCLFVCFFFCLFVCVVVCSFVVCLLCLFVCLLIVFVCLSVSFFVCLFVCLLCLFVCSTSLMCLRTPSESLNPQSHADMSTRVFWIAASLLESDYEHEFLMAIVLINKVGWQLPNSLLLFSSQSGVLLSSPSQSGVLPLFSVAVRSPSSLLLRSQESFLSSPS